MMQQYQFNVYSVNVVYTTDIGKEGLILGSIPGCIGILQFCSEIGKYIVGLNCAIIYETVLLSVITSNPSQINFVWFVNQHFCYLHDDVIKWKHFPRYWPFVWGIHRSRWIPRT